jgi:hypothetical protein
MSRGEFRIIFMSYACSLVIFHSAELFCTPLRGRKNKKSWECFEIRNLA